MATAIERRAFEVTEFRAVKDTLRISGHAAVFNRMSENLGGFREQVAPGAFKQTIVEEDVRALWNHDPNYVLGRNRSGTLLLSEDQKGLATEITVPDTQWARDLLVTIERGDVNQMSFGFRTMEDRWERVDGMQEELRTLLRVQLFDVSPVTFPAYPQTDVGAAKRSLEQWRSGQIPLARLARRNRQTLVELNN